MAADARLPRSTPEAQGVPSAALLAFIDSIESAQLELHSFMVVRHGSVVAEGWWDPYAADLPHMLFSLSKSFTSSAVGIAVSEGRLSIEDPVISFFPDKLPTEISDNLAAMTVRDLLIMGTGHSEEANLWASDGDWVRAFLAHPVPHVPGTHFLYNTPATYMQAAIVEKLTGESLLDYLTPRLFAPLGIENPTWMRCPQGACTGGYGLSIRTEDIAKFGQLYLQKGEWQGRQLIEPVWIEAATYKQISNGDDPNGDWSQGYGYQFWKSRHGAYRGDGAFGQYCIVLPSQDTVVAITAGLGDMQGVLNRVWEILLPAFGSEALDESSAHAELVDRLANLSILVPAGEPSSETFGRVEQREFRFDENEVGWTSLVLSRHEADLRFQLRSTKGDRDIVAGFDRWIESPATVDNRGDIAALRPQGGPFASRATWTDDKTLVIRSAETETPFVETFKLRFFDAKVELESNLSAHFWDTKTGPLVADLL
jgi:CubicO group peptidase (beta-lactamase class C family)